MPIEINKSCTVITGNSISFFRLLTIRSGLRAELRGMRLTRGVSCYAIAKEEFNLKGNKQKVLEQIEKIIQEESAKQVRVVEVEEGTHPMPTGRPSDGKM